MALPAALNPILRGAALLFLLAAVAACARTPASSGGLGDNSLAGGGGIGLAGSGAPGSVQEFQVTVGDRVFFETDSSILTAQAQQILDRQAVWLARYSNRRVLIEGHADERGTREYNIALGARRANVVMNYLISRGVAANRLSTFSYGKERPVAVCNDISCWSQNRRAVTAVQ